MTQQYSSWEKIVYDLKTFTYVIIKAIDGVTDTYSMSGIYNKGSLVTVSIAMLCDITDTFNNKTAN